MGLSQIESTLIKVETITRGEWVKDISLPNSEPHRLVAYVDGSFDNRTKSVGGGVVLLYGQHRMELSYPSTDRDIIFDKSLQVKENWNKITTHRNVGGELLACMRAVTIAMNLEHIKELVIYYDYSGLEKWANKEWKANTIWTRSYQSLIDYARNNVGLNIQYIKVKSHSNDKYNDLADLLAKRATKYIIKP